MTRFNVDEILAVAEQIERNGAAFYRKAAEAQEEGPLRDMLLELAAMEDEHVKVFASIRASLGSSRNEGPAELDEQQELYLRAYASGHLFDSDLDPVEAASSFGNVKDVLRFAIGLEKDSVMYYTAMKELVPEDLGRKEVDRIIMEEINHAAQLADRLASLGRTARRER